MLSREAILAGSTQKKYNHEDQSTFISRISHVSVTGRGIVSMDSISICNNLTVLYLYDNKISEIKGLENCHQLMRLYLQNNHVETISGLDVGLEKLSVLNLSNNRIHNVSGLTNLPNLTELYVDKMVLPKGTSIEFDLDTIASLSLSLEKLSCTGNNLENITILGFLQELQTLDLSNNSITDMDLVEEVAMQCKNLNTLKITENRLNDRYLRQKLILANFALRSINGKDVSDTERAFLVKLEGSKVARSKAPSKAATPMTPQQDLGPVPMPHLPPYATQYRDIILEKIGKQK